MENFRHRLLDNGEIVLPTDEVYGLYQSETGPDHRWQLATDIVGQEYNKAWMFPVRRRIIDHPVCFDVTIDLNKIPTNSLFDNCLSAILNQNTKGISVSTYDYDLETIHNCIGRLEVLGHTVRLDKESFGTYIRIFRND